MTTQYASSVYQDLHAAIQERGSAQYGGGQSTPGWGPNGRQAPIQAGHHNFRTKPCRYFLAGMCKNGDQCTFLHAREGQLDARGAGAGGQQQQQQQQQRFQPSYGGGAGAFNQMSNGFSGQNFATQAFNM